MAKFPDESRVINAWSVSHQLNIFLKVDTLSNPALVLVSDINNKPLFVFIPIQYVIGCFPLHGLYLSTAYSYNQPLQQLTQISAVHH